MRGPASLALLLVPVLAMSVIRPAIAKEPSEYVREMLALQDLMAQGDLEAPIKRAEAVKATAEAFAATPHEAWESPKNARALIVYVLSGGDPTPLLQVLRRGGLEQFDKALLAGVVAFADGRQKQATETMADYDIRGLDATLGATISLAQANLLARQNRKKAMEHLDRVRLLVPGTFMEETALRQLSLLNLEEGDLQRAAWLAAQHARRFPKSLFADVFRSRFAMSMIERNSKDMDADILVLKSGLARIDQMSASRFFIGIARAGLHQGRVEFASRAAKAALDIAPESSSEHTRALLYNAAAEAVTERAADALSALKALPSSTLNQDEQGVRMAAMAMAEEVQRGAPAPKPSSPDDDAERSRKIASPGAARERAIQALKMSNELLQGARP